MSSIHAQGGVSKKMLCCALLLAVHAVGDLTGVRRAGIPQGWGLGLATLGDCPSNGLALARALCTLDGSRMLEPLRLPVDFTHFKPHPCCAVHRGTQSWMLCGGSCNTCGISATAGCGRRCKDTSGVHRCGHHYAETVREHSGCGNAVHANRLGAQLLPSG